MADQAARNLTVEHIKELISVHQDRPATARHRFGALSRFLDFLLERKVIAANPATNISRKNKPKTLPPKYILLHGSGENALAYSPPLKNIPSVLKIFDNDTTARRRSLRIKVRTDQCHPYGNLIDGRRH